MQYTYKEAVRELSDFIGKNATADNFWKMEQVLLTVLEGNDAYHQSIYEEGYDLGYEQGYEAGVEAERDSWSCK